MSDYPSILAHNVLKGATFSIASAVGREPWRMTDGLKWTWWEGASASTQYIYVKVANLLQNGDFEKNADEWYLSLAGGASGTFARNTTSPLEGAGDGFMDVADADNQNKKFIVVSIKTYFLQAGRTYRFSFVAKSDTVRNFRYGFINPDLSSETVYSENQIGTGAAELYCDFTPSASGEYRPYWRALTAGDFFVDDAHLCEVRDIDSFAVAPGHTLNGYMLQIHRAETIYSNCAYTNWNNGYFILTDRPIYIENSVTGKGVKWRIKLSTSGLPFVVAPRIPLAWLGRRWSLPRNFSGPIDPDAKNTFNNPMRGERGIETATYKYSQRLFNGVLKHITPDDYKNYEMFMEDTNDGVEPFAFSLEPQSGPREFIPMRLDKPFRNAPYAGGYFREWPFNAVEIAG